jgi:hypothetical protein
MFEDVTESFGMVLGMIIGVVVLVAMIGYTVQYKESEKLVGKTFIESADAYRALTAPCLSAEDSKRNPIKFLFDKEKLDQESAGLLSSRFGGVSCLDIDKVYAVKITDLEDNEEWKMEYLISEGPCFGPCSTETSEFGYAMPLFKYKYKSKEKCDLYCDSNVNGYCLKSDSEYCCCAEIFPSVDYNFTHMVNIKVGDEMHLGKFEFGVMK